MAQIVRKGLCTCSTVLAVNMLPDQISVIIRLIDISGTNRGHLNIFCITSYVWKGIELNSRTINQILGLHFTTRDVALRVIPQHFNWQLKLPIPHVC